MSDGTGGEIIARAGSIIGRRPPDSLLARDAVVLAQSVSAPVLFNHVMRSYCFAELLSKDDSADLDREVLFLSSVLHDLGLTDHAAGERRFEIEGADAAFGFLKEHDLAEAQAWAVWDAIALHTTDINLHRRPEARAFQRGILADFVGLGLERLERSQLEGVLAGFPRLDFKRQFTAALQQDTERKPLSLWFHPTMMIAHHCLNGVAIPDARAIIFAAPFEE
jgi:hypothetical protein